MNEKFFKAIKEIGVSNPDNIVKQLHALFTNISTMTGPETIAAFHTIREVNRNLDLNNVDARLTARHIADSINDRMIAITLQTPYEKRVGIALTFREAVGVMRAERFNIILREANQLEQTYASLRGRR